MTFKTPDDDRDELRGVHCACGWIIGITLLAIGVISFAAVIFKGMGGGYE